ncbi:MAG: alpha/beta fold hydrolase [Actinomycetota bacterium]
MSRFPASGWRSALLEAMRLPGIAGLVVAGLVLGGGIAPAASAASAAERTGPSESFGVTVPAAPGSTATFRLDVDLYLPATSRPAPAVLLAHGFGGSKRTVANDAERIRREGYVVMAYSARGFGRSGGRISLDSLDYEVADAKRLVDVLNSRSEVEKRDGDPVVGVVGASYGGALALMLGATDRRIDTVVASITWNDLALALVPQSAADGAVSEPGVFKQAWATQLFGAAASPSAGACGRFTAELCALYTKLVGGGQLDTADRSLLAASSPASVLSGMAAPTLLLQGRQDSLFGLDQADANARAIAAAGAPVSVSWFAGGHDGGQTAGTTATVDRWLSARLRGGSSHHWRPAPFSFTVPASARGFAETRIAARYPGLTGGSTRALPLRSHFDVVVNPPGGLPATISSLPGTGPLDSAIGGLVGGVVGGAVGVAGQSAQQAKFTTGPITTPFVLAGSPSVTVAVRLPHFRGGDPESAPSAAPVDVLLFAQLRVLSGGADIAVGGGVAPIRVPVPADGSVTRVKVRLPATTWRFERGDRVGLSLRTTDAGYQGSPTTATFAVGTVGDLSLPTVASSDPTVAGGAPSTAAVIGIPIVLLIALVFGIAIALIGPETGRRRDRRTLATLPPDDAPPLVIRGLTKNYRAGFRAVDDLSFTVRRGQVLGLLGPNGAGKTTVLRMVTGLLRPDAGEIEIFGEKVSPGSPVLARVGCFIEGPGFLSHLSGRRNLQLFWAASGRPRADARLAEALDIADLGTAINRRVGGYSQGMKQRLAIAQAMLGMPEVLILDEPTNGLDPPQIFALRGVLRRYAETGRTVIVSSHLLGEVEQTCSDVVVMARGRLLAAGPVAELAGDTTELTIEVTDVDAAVVALLGLDGVEASILAEGTLRVLPAVNSAESVVAAIAAAGIGIRSVTRGRHLEEAFLDLVGTEGII